MNKIIAIIIVLFTAFGAHAAEIRTASGSSTGSADKQRRNTVLPPSHAERYEYLEVCGCCEKDVQCDMTDKAIRWKDGNAYDALTKWRVTWDYGCLREGQACLADSFRVTTEIVYHLPKWVCEGHAPQSLTDKWDRYIKHLKLHEEGHGDKALKAAESLTRAVAEMGPASSCAELDRNVQRLCQERMKQLDREQEEYDAATDNGRTRGEAFP